MNFMNGKLFCRQQWTHPNINSFLTIVFCDSVSLQRLFSKSNLYNTLLRIVAIAML